MLPPVKFSDDYFPCQKDYATPDAAFVNISSNSDDDSSEEDQTSNMRSTTLAGDTYSKYSTQSDYNTDSCDFSAYTEDQVASDSEDVHPTKSDGAHRTKKKDNNNSNDAAKKRKSEVSDTSASNARKKLNIGQSAHGHTSTAAYDTRSTSNPSTVVGLSSDWSPTFLL
ncbi:hypothetical protein ACOSQ2_013206 [Xanthoceras sorbifolium]